MGDLGSWEGGSLESGVTIEDVKHIGVGDLVKHVEFSRKKGIVLSFIDHEFFDTKVLWENGIITAELSETLVKVIEQ